LEEVQSEPVTISESSAEATDTVVAEFFAPLVVGDICSDHNKSAVLEGLVAAMGVEEAHELDDQEKGDKGQHVGIGREPAKCSVSIPPPPATPGTGIRKKCKPSAPISKIGLRKGLRSDKNGYVEMALPNQPCRRKPSLVPLAPKPDVMQISMMQKIRMEQCQVDPEDLTKEILRRPRS
jgi:hypothetical protein